MSEDNKDQYDKINEKLLRTSGIFGELPASAFLVSEDNPAGAPAPQQVTPGADYTFESDNANDVDEDFTESDRIEAEENQTFSGPAHAAQAGAVDPTDGSTQTTASPEDQANLAAVEGNDVVLGDSESVQEANKAREEDEKNKQEEQDAAAKEQADKAATDDSAEKTDDVEQPGVAKKTSRTRATKNDTSK